MNVPTKSKMIARCINKPSVQLMIKALRSSGLTVDKIGMRYVCKIDDVEIFSALNGSHNYLVRMREDLFV